MTKLRTLFHGSATDSYIGSIYGLFLIRRSGLWATRWRALHPGYNTVPPPPPVDLARETVIMLAVGQRPVLGYEVTIESVTVRDETLVVTATESRNINGCLDAISSPVHIVAAPINPQSFDKMLLNLLIKPLQDQTTD